ncbi:hypothetical protein A1O3_09626 [Capronia epimyces CBS 606.96]|uniref:Survival Motor Neuron Gemin2-binding domain-containing protein n=1 Tax=Capronia epimyces CBS 606.96 TaxID=1182542 RepID=W9XJ95_9EURO|nr:uncharacterized protein A1O3_09626 [Capronia epimyces CBS 606.96]EXJ77400.1 hypothetical protein A1O3_09626 [Capronia epimyces CBS 606.96]
MPKNKKAKTKHYSSKPPGELSQAEIWDDSALIRSWNDAVAEYEYYHSIHARGEDVEEILRKAEMDDLDPVEAAPKNERHDVDVDTTAGHRASLGAAHSEDGEIDDDEVVADLQAAKDSLARQGTSTSDSPRHLHFPQTKTTLLRVTRQG